MLELSLNEQKQINGGTWLIRTSEGGKVWCETWNDVQSTTSYFDSVGESYTITEL
jgi:hypothetical protein